MTTAILLVGTATCGSADAQTLQAAQAGRGSNGAVQAYAAKLKADWANRALRGDVPAVVTEPSVRSGKILTPNVDVTKAPGVAALELTLDAGTVGVSYLQVLLTAPSADRVLIGSVFLPAYPAQTARQTVKLQIPSINSGFGTEGGFGFYTQPGAWTVSTIQVTSEDGTFVMYNGGQIATLFPSTVVNVTNSGTPDVTAPTVGNGKILTPAVSIGGSSPYFAARLAVADNLSGVANVSIDALAPGGTFPSVFASANISLPVQQGHVIPYAMLPSNAATGTYTISGYSVCDVAGNCVGGSSAASIKAVLGTTTFQVTP